MPKESKLYKARFGLDENGNDALFVAYEKV